MACKRDVRVRSIPVPADGAQLVIASDVAEFMIGVVDGAGAAVAWTLEREDDTANTPFHMPAGAVLTEDRLELTGQLIFRVRSAVVAVLEVVEWGE